MVEATINPKYQRIKDYLMNMSKDNNISEEFVDRFVYNYINKDQWVQSDVLYEWFGKQHNTDYKNFVKEITKQLTIDSEYKVLQKVAVYNYINKGGRGHKTIYLVSQSGIKQMAMTGDKQVRKYYAQLEVLMFNYIDQREDELQQTIDQKTKETEELKTYIEDNKEEYVIYDKTVVETGEQYRGITNNLKRRNSQHRTASCNPGLRQAIEQGKEIETTIVKRFRSLSRKECRDIERAAILEIPYQYRLNKKIPKALEERKDIISEQEDELTVINENITLEKFQDRVIILKEFIEKYGRYPLQRGKSQEEKSLASFVQYIRKGASGLITYKNTMRSISQQYIDVVKQQIPDFIWRSHKSKHQQEVEKRNQSFGQSHQNQSINQQDQFNTYIDETPYTIQNIQQLLNEIIPNFNIDITPVSKVWLGNLYKCLVYKKLFNEFPKDSKSKRFGDPLGKFLRRQVSNEVKLTKIQEQVLQQLGVEKHNKSSDQYKEIFQKFITDNKRLPKCQEHDQDEKKLYKWMTRNKDISNQILKELLSSIPE